MIDWLFTSAKAQIVAGTTLASTPAWVLAFQNVSLIAGAIAAVSGAIIAVLGAIRAVREYRRTK